MNRILEVCVDSYASAVAAIAGGADRLELCSALSVGGLTPSAALLRQIRRVSKISVRCLMRPRGGDFLYTSEEVEQMAMEMAVLRDAGADGFVIGCLTAEGELDGKAMEPLRKAAMMLALTPAPMRTSGPFSASRIFSNRPMVSIPSQHFPAPPLVSTVSKPRFAAFR